MIEIGLAFRDVANKPGMMAMALRVFVTTHTRKCPT
jgi:hypothetical protein